MINNIIMDESILSLGNQRSEEMSDYNRSVTAYNKQISKKINDLQKTPKADTSKNDLTYAFKDGLLSFTGKATAKDLSDRIRLKGKYLPKGSYQEVQPTEAHDINIDSTPSGDLVKFDSLEEGPSLYKMPPEVQPSGDIVKFDSLEEGPSVYKMPSEVQATGTVDDPIPAEPVTVEAQAPQEARLANAADESVAKTATKEFGLQELGEAAGIAEGADAISQDIEGKWKTFNTAQKVGNFADIAGAALDSAAVALPFTAPVTATLGSVADVIGSVADEIGSDKAEQLKKQGEVQKGISNLQSQKKQYQSSPVFGQIGLMASPIHDTSRITGSYSF